MSGDDVTLPASLIDSEPFDATEEQFAASLLSTAGGLPVVHDDAPPPEPPLAVATPSAPVNAGSVAPELDAWRNEVASRINSYRSRRQRAADASLSLEFDPGERVLTPAQEARAATVQRVAERFAAAAAAGIAVAVPEPVITQRQDVAPNVIVFPRPTRPTMVVKEQMQRSLLDELAETLHESPRILDAPEPEPHTVAPQMPAITLNESFAPPIAASEFELPLVVAGVSPRMYASVIDNAIVAVGVALFALVGSQIAGRVPDLRALFGAIAFASLVFWTTYHVLLLTYAGGTPGMEMARLAMRDFEGQPLPRAARRGRALAMLVSAAPLGLGFWWAFFDEDTLCWHDRITQTCMVEEAVVSTQE